MLVFLFGLQKKLTERPSGQESEKTSRRLQGGGVKVLVRGKEYKLWFEHSFFDEDDPVQLKGITDCFISLGEECVSAGAALCSLGDNFVKATGRKIALARALKPFSREDRKEVWDQYFATVKK